MVETVVVVVLEVLQHMMYLEIQESTVGGAVEVMV
jgi:hypothetical protein